MHHLKSLPILMYHHISFAKGLVTLSPQTFFIQMQALAQAGFHSIGTRELESFFSGQALPAKSVLISFDDGYLDNRVYAYPILKMFGLRAVIFLASAWIKNAPARSFAQIRIEKNARLTVENAAKLPPTPEHNICKAKIAQNQAQEVILNLEELYAMQDVFEYHPHTHTHQRFDQLFHNATEKRNALAKDLMLAQHFFQTHFGQKSAHLCWPQGYFDNDYVEVAQKMNFRFLYTTQPGANTPDNPPLNLHRFVTKEKGAFWIKSRTLLYSSPFWARLYAKGR